MWLLARNYATLIIETKIRNRERERERQREVERRNTQIMKYRNSNEQASKKTNEL